ncbi:MULTISPECIES: hypothetical protein [unclassified Paenibacillus]|uniref:hypothetical protein n=1 Tax=unclassified Paenibacillus TaxID=185978 RepID=UPI002474B13E|nr:MULTISPECIES: hypothetical protein [unclassified Paenibacillus]MDH6430292.1 hypothetical protein [Paenibacillus sp. PastH-4]MDH6446507.1 hypothetical protein [Paenibacillus sp. PastF-4]MDH6530027.1 hypothetical protein [Paenibacillus sp. PastH-3]
MDGYKHYIRIDDTGRIIYGFSDAFEQPLEGDILVSVDAPRHFHENFTEPLVNDRGQFRFKWKGDFLERSQSEFDAEWLNRPLTPPTEIEILREENTELKLALTELAEAQEADKTEMQLALAEIAGLIGGE